LGVALHNAGKLDEAISMLSKVEQDFPHDIWVTMYAPFFRAHVYTEQQEWQKVFEITRTALNIDPSNVLIMLMHANTLGALNRPDEARETWHQLTVLFPNATVENYEWWLEQGFITDERVEPFVMGLRLAGVEEKSG